MVCVLTKYQRHTAKFYTALLNICIPSSNLLSTTWSWYHTQLASCCQEPYQGSDFRWFSLWPWTLSFVTLQWHRQFPPLGALNPYIPLYFILHSMTYHMAQLFSTCELIWGLMTTFLETLWCIVVSHMYNPSRNTLTDTVSPWERQHTANHIISRD